MANPEARAQGEATPKEAGAAFPVDIARRAFLGRLGLGTLALCTMGAGAAVGAPTHHAARARRVIYLYMAGGPSHLEILDPKPVLARLHGQPMPESFTANESIAQLQGQKLKCLRPLFGFKKHGRAGQELCELFPHLGGVADQLAIIRSMRTDAINHDPAHTLMNTGTTLGGRPSMGSWVLYGLGSECENLPGFVVLTSTEGRSPQPISTRQWHSGFLPGQFQGVELRAKGDAVLYVKNPPGVSDARQGDVVEAVRQIDRVAVGTGAGSFDLEREARIAQYEMAFKMQTSVPGLMDTTAEPESVRALYGCTPGDGSFASNCLLARRLAERGVRFIQLYHRDWDHHNDLARFLPQNAANVDRAIAALIIDLRQRGLFEDTLIVWGGEFGRTPMAQSNKGGPGRDHHKNGFSMFLCGGGIRGGITHGATDELGYNAVQDVVHVNDLHATMLHLLGINHRRLTHRFQGRDWRLTDVHGEIVRAVLA